MDTVESTYGSDKHGLIWGYRFAAGSAPASIVSEEVVPWLESAGQPVSDSFLWLHFSLSNTASERWLHQNLRLPEAFYQSLREQVSSTRVELEGETLVAVIHDAMFDFTLDPESIATVNLCMTPRLLVTARLRPVRSVDRLRGVVRGGQVLHSPADLLAHLLGAVDLQELRQAAEEFSTAIADSAALVERIRLLQEELSALLGEQTSRTLFVLTVVTVLALPINLIAGLFGMNVGGIPLAEHPRGFVLVVGGIAAVTMVAAYLALGRRRE